MRAVLSPLLLLPASPVLGQWAGRSLCWDKTHTFARCCDTKKGSTGDTTCWTKDWNYDTCWCAEPKSCDGTYGECDSSCEKKYTWNKTNVAACATKVPKDQSMGGCKMGEGKCKSVLRNCTAPFKNVPPKNGKAGTCTKKQMKHGEECKPTCDKDFEISGAQFPTCENGTITGKVRPPLWTLSCLRQTPCLQRPLTCSHS